MNRSVIGYLNVLGSGYFFCEFGSVGNVNAMHLALIRLSSSFHKNQKEKWSDRIIEWEGKRENDNNLYYIVNDLIIMVKLLFID
jgi:hypothetical protein